MLFLTLKRETLDSWLASYLHCYTLSVSANRKPAKNKVAVEKDETDNVKVWRMASLAAVSVVGNQQPLSHLKQGSGLDSCLLCEFIVWVKKQLSGSRAFTNLSRYTRVNLKQNDA